MSRLLAVAGKDLRSEVRARQLAPVMILFSLVLVFLFTMALPPGAGRDPVPLPSAGAVGAREISAAFLWASLLFASIIGLGRSAALEKEGGRVEALALTPADPATIYLGKLLANVTFISAVQLVVIPTFALFTETPLLPLLPEIIVIMLLANVGLASSGTLFASVSQHSTAKELLLPLLAFPAMLPVVLGSTRLTAALLTAGAFGFEFRWVVLLLVYDVIFCTIGAVTYEYVITG